MPEPVKSRATRQAEYILQLAVARPVFKKAAWQKLSQRLGGPNPQYESPEKITDVWCLPTSPGNKGHGAEFPLALPGRCIALSTDPGDLVLDPFLGSGTTAVAAMELNRRCLGFDISDEYVRVARERVEAARLGGVALWDADGEASLEPTRVAANGHEDDSAANGAHLGRALKQDALS